MKPVSTAVSHLSRSPRGAIADIGRLRLPLMRKLSKRDCVADNTAHPAFDQGRSLAAGVYSDELIAGTPTEKVTT